MQFDILVIENPQASSFDQYAGFKSLHVKTFGELYTNEVEQELARKFRSMLVVAYKDSQVLGFKLGYEDGLSTFYSWTGAVDESARRHGVGKSLMEKQHEWCQSSGYKKIVTKTKNRWRDMIILNLRQGFEIIGTYTDGHGEAKLILEKKL